MKTSWRLPLVASLVTHHRRLPALAAAGAALLGLCGTAPAAQAEQRPPDLPPATFVAAAHHVLDLEVVHGRLWASDAEHGLCRLEAGRLVASTCLPVAATDVAYDAAQQVLYLAAGPHGVLAASYDPKYGHFGVPRQIGGSAIAELSPAALALSADGRLCAGTADAGSVLCLTARPGSPLNRFHLVAVTDSGTGVHRLAFHGDNQDRLYVLDQTRTLSWIESLKSAQCIGACVTRPLHLPGLPTTAEFVEMASGSPRDDSLFGVRVPPNTVTFSPTSSDFSTLAEVGLDDELPTGCRRVVPVADAVLESEADAAVPLSELTVTSIAVDAASGTGYFATAAAPAAAPTWPARVWQFPVPTLPC